MYKTILVPIDMSQVEKGKSMIDVAREQGDKDARIILLHVIEDIPNWVAAEIPTGILEKSRQSIQEENRDNRFRRKCKPSQRRRQSRPMSKFTQVTLTKLFLIRLEKKART